MTDHPKHFSRGTPRAMLFALLALALLIASGCASAPRTSSHGKKTTKRTARVRPPVAPPAAQPVTPPDAPATPIEASTAAVAAPEIVGPAPAVSAPAVENIAATPPETPPTVAKTEGPTKLRRLKPEGAPPIRLGVSSADKTMASATNNEARLIFDFPVTYNSRVRKWIKYFQTSGRSSFRRWLERSSRFIPGIQEEMKRANLPLDLAYVAMIESGFSSNASSHASALGMWQFIAPTGTRYGLSIDWWIDERCDFEKSTKAAVNYMTDLFQQFGSWYLVAASYNMGENGVRRLIKRHGTNSFWALADRGALPEETRNYLPKMLAAMLIAKAPALYGFRDLEFQVPFSYDTLDVPGGTDLINLANHLGVSERAITELNPELLKAFVPREVKTHRIRIPKGSKIAVSQYVNGATRTIQ